MKKVDFDRYARDYNELLREQTGFFSGDESYFARYKVAIAGDLVKKAPARVLELGCGTGRNIAFLRERFPDATIMGSDVSSKSLDVARADNPGVHFWKEGSADGEQAGFDLVFVAGVFHHVPPSERDALASRIAALLNPAGRAVVFEHNPYNPVTRRIVSQCPYDEGVILLGARELRARLEQGGLRADRHGYALFFPPRWGLARVERMLGWLPLGGQYWIVAARR
ncbi:MAG TPA: class I SAM-dependent methyltransferase [Casimicrobiaceae bacterium]|nr:class I SAM-dependent methyltransferase [Casimicrobiaceae bacterium]